MAPDQLTASPAAGARWASLNIMLGAFVAALIVLPVNRLAFVLQVLGTLIHELGHTVAAWLFGYPAVPALDFMYGGGVTLHQGRSLVVLGLVYAGAGMVAYRTRRDPLVLGCVVGFTALHVVCAATALHEALFLVMGHGFELLFAGIFLYRGLSGAAVVHRVERPMYAFLGWFFVLFNMRFAFRLLTDPGQRALYEQAKGGGHWMDFSRLAEQVLHTDLSAVAAGYLAVSLLPAVVALVAFRYRAVLGRLVERVATAASTPE